MFLALNLVLTKKPRFAKHINGKIRQVNIKNWTYYFYNDRINLKDFDESLLKIDRKDYKDIYIYEIGYVTVKIIANFKNINRVNPLYLMINDGSLWGKKWE